MPRSRHFFGEQRCEGIDMSTHNKKHEVELGKACMTASRTWLSDNSSSGPRRSAIAVHSSDGTIPAIEALLFATMIDRKTDTRR